MTIEGAPSNSETEIPAPGYVEKAVLYTSLILAFALPAGANEKSDDYSPDRIPALVENAEANSESPLRKAIVRSLREDVGRLNYEKAVVLLHHGDETEILGTSEGRDYVNTEFDGEALEQVPRSRRSPATLESLHTHPGKGKVIPPSTVDILGGLDLLRSTPKYVEFVSTVLEPSGTWTITIDGDHKFVQNYNKFQDEFQEALLSLVTSAKMIDTSMLSKDFRKDPDYLEKIFSGAENPEEIARKVEELAEKIMNKHVSENFQQALDDLSTQEMRLSIMGNEGRVAAIPDYIALAKKLGIMIEYKPNEN